MMTTVPRCYLSSRQPPGGRGVSLDRWFDGLCFFFNLSVTYQKKKTEMAAEDAYMYHVTTSPPTTIQTEVSHLRDERCLSHICQYQ